MARGVSWATRKYADDAAEHQRNVVLAVTHLQYLLDIENVKLPPDHRFFIGQAARDALKPRGVGFFREWLLIHNLGRFEFVPDSALMVSEFRPPFDVREATYFLRDNPPGLQNKQLYESVHEFVADFCRNRPLYGRCRIYCHNDVNFCTRLEYPMMFHEVLPLRGAEAHETVVYFRDTISTALLFGHFGVASQILHHRGAESWIRADSLNLRTETVPNEDVLRERPMIADSQIALDSPEHVTHAACLLEGFFMKYYMVGDESDGADRASFPHLEFISRYLFAREWGPKYGEIALDKTLNKWQAVDRIKDQIYLNELPPWLRILAILKIGHLCKDFAIQFYQYCNPNATRIGFGVTGRKA